MARYRNSSWRSFDPAQLRQAEPAVAAAPGRCRVLGIDPGSLRTGFGIVDCDGATQVHVASGCIRAGGATRAARLLSIHEAVTALVTEHRPDEIAIERVFIHRNPDSALKLGQARGVAICAAAAQGAPVFEYAPQAVKLALVGHGGAEKEQVAHMVRVILGLTIDLPLDATDALAIGLCHGQGRRLNHLAALALRSGA
jgi:crossover junction endodeoxyribonuclease RuvC